MNLLQVECVQKNNSYKVTSKISANIFPRTDSQKIESIVLQIEM